MENLQQYLEELNNEVKTLKLGTSPSELYEPIKYLMNLGGKRLRPLLVLLSYQINRDDYRKILQPALAVEVFHNFTLMHDDIMDNAPIRRGRPTVHEKWDANIAILSGDTMMVKAYDMLLAADRNIFPEIIKTFNKCAMEVCEGQQLDMNFERVDTVSEDEYLHMIKLKTAVLLGFSLELGGILSDASEQNKKLLREFGVNIGIGFQLKDDLLDVYGDKEKFGKQVGGDIVSNKKTFLLIKALERAEGATENELKKWLAKGSFDKSEKVKIVKEIYDSLDIKNLTMKKIDDFFQKGFDSLNKVVATESRKKPLRDFAQYLINREQ